MTAKPKIVILSCEHAVDTIPDKYQQVFEGQESLLNSHRAIDFGAKEIAIHLSQTLDCTLFMAKASRILIDCNRSLGNKGLFSEISSQFSATEKEKIINEYYLPFRNQVKEQIQLHITAGFQVIHLSIHSFTPIFHEVVRNAEFGLLYDPKRPSEKAFAHALQKQLRSQTKEWHTRLNYPYKGTADGFTSALRREFPDEAYVGIEIESNQALTRNNEASLQKVCFLLEKSLKVCLNLGPL
jgi:predicted N-formylglutamate amidohydrolase